MTIRDSHIYSRSMVILLVLLMLISVFPFCAFAADTKDNFKEELVLTGSFEGRFDLSSSRSKLFHLESIVPGDKWSGQIVIKNKASDKMTIQLLSIKSNLEDLILFNALNLEIREGKEVIYTGSYNTALSPITKTYELDPEETLVLDVTVWLPVTAGNEIMSKTMDSTWTFEALYPEGVQKPQTGVDLMAGNSVAIFVLFIILLASFAAIIIVRRIRAINKTDQTERH